MSCHDAIPADEAQRISATATALDQPQVVLVGNPNVGKSTLFNALTGARQRTMNAPGTTVTWELGRWHLDAEGHDARLVDVPGTQSLIAISPDEEVTVGALTRGGALQAPPDLVVVVADATALSRSLYLLAQVAETGLPTVVAVTMTDVARSRGIHLDSAQLAQVLAVPCVEVDPRSRSGLDALTTTVRHALTDRPRLTLPDTGAATPGTWDTPDELVAHLWERADAHFDWVASTEEQLDAQTTHQETWSDRIDRVLLNPWCGIPVFLGVMWLVFQLTTTVAAPMQDGIDRFFSGVVGPGLTSFLGLFGLADSWLNSLVVDGLVAGAATVATFIPPMGIMFLALSVLEDSGYIARAGFVTDRIMRLLGLDGRAFLPLVIGFGCNLPALAATRTLPNARQRLLTGLLIPFASCTARLTVFVVMATVFFPRNPGTAIFAMYLSSILLILGGGVVLRRTVMRDVHPEPFVLNLPAYQAPRLRPMFTSVLMRTRDFVLRAGKVIVAMLLVMWVLLAIPVTGGSFGNTAAEDSLYGVGARAIAPVFTPAGFGDWHASAALVTGFIAKEVVVGTLAQSYAVSEPQNPGEPGDLATQLRATFERTSGGSPGAAAAAFMLFVLAYTPCAATVAEQRRQFGTKPAVLAVVVSVTLAWVLAVAVFQVGRLL